MQNYLELLERTMRDGDDVLNARTGEVCRTIAGASLRYDLDQGFPAVTTKRLAFTSARAELLGFFRGYDSAADFRALGTKIWDLNANASPGWLANPYRKGQDDLGRCYGVQWTDSIHRRVVTDAGEMDRLAAAGWRVTMRDAEQGCVLMERRVNQLEEALKCLLDDPTDRRIIVSAWRPDEFDLMALPPCHVDYRFVAIPDANRLHLITTMRSTDLALGAPFNLATSALLLSIMARLSGFRPATLTLQMANAHIYASHYDGVREQLRRVPMALPRLVLSDAIQPVGDRTKIAGAFSRIENDQIWLEGYESYPAIAMPMAP